MGSAVLLQKVSVFSPTPTIHYLNVTADNIVRVFPVSTKLPEGFEAPNIPRLLPPQPSSSTGPHQLASSSSNQVIPTSGGGAGRPSSSSSLSSRASPNVLPSGHGNGNGNGAATDILPKQQSRPFPPSLLSRVKPDIGAPQQQQQATAPRDARMPIPPSPSPVVARPPTSAAGGSALVVTTATAPSAPVNNDADIDALMEEIEFT
jgi:hypothetical protein